MKDLWVISANGRDNLTGFRFPINSTQYVSLDNGRIAVWQLIHRLPRYAKKLPKKSLKEL